MFRNNCRNVIHVPGYNKTEICPPVCHQPINFVKTNHFTHIIPHVHPVQITEVNKHLFQNAHHFPHSHQSVNQASYQDVQYGSVRPPCPGCTGM